jgi:hypothetical protein
MQDMAAKLYKEPQVLLSQQETNRSKRLIGLNFPFFQFQSYAK